MRFLFEAHNRRGLGHFVRGLNIAHEIQSRDPNSQIVFLCNSKEAETWPGEFRTLYSGGDGADTWRRAVRLFLPNAIVYDTILPDHSLDPGAAREVYICRKCHPAKQKEIFRNRLFERLSLILIPHSEEECKMDLPASWQEHCVYVGPIVRPLHTAVQESLRSKYGIGPDHFVLVSTAGGGGFEDAATFFELTFRVHSQLSDRIPDLRHLVILGPRFSFKLNALPGMELVRFEPELANLFAISNLIIAQGGYNTANEIRSAQTPAVFIPASRAYDDQLERVSLLKRKGLCAVFPPESVEETSRQVARLCCSRSKIQEMKQAYSTDRMETGNSLAAEKILELVKS